MMKTKLSLLALVLVSIFAVYQLVTPTHAHAAIENNCSNGAGNVSGICSGSGAPSSGLGYAENTCGSLRGKSISATGFVGTYLCTPDNAEIIPAIISNLANYLVTLGTFILVLIVAIAGVQITTGGASPEAIKAGKRRIALAISSIALLTVSRVVLDLLGITGGKFLGVDVTNFQVTPGNNTLNQIIGAITNYVYFAGGTLAVVMIIYGGVVMMTSAGNPQRIQAARRVITYAIIGLVVMVAAGVIVGAVAKAITG